MAHEKVAKAILREVPAGHIDTFLGSFGKMARDACGAGCGGCGYGCATSNEPDDMVVDRYGHTGVTKQELQAAHGDIPGLKKELHEQIKHVIS